MQNSRMPRMKTSITMPFDLMDSAGDSWPLLVVFLRIASEHPYGIIPDESISLARVRRVFAAPDDEIRRQAACLCDRGIFAHVDYETVARGNGWERKKKLSGWYCPSWPSVSSDRRRVSRDGIVIHPEARLFEAQRPVKDGRNEMQRLEDKALACMNLGGRRGRVLAIDSISLNWLIKLHKEYGFDAVSGALEESAGADRPVAMAKKILMGPKKGRGSSVPSADEWRQG